MLEHEWIAIIRPLLWCRHGCDRMVVGFMTTYAIGAYHHWRCELESRSDEVNSILDTILCDKVCQWLAAVWWFSLGTPVSSTNETDHHDISEILLKVALNTITLTFFLWLIDWLIYLFIEVLRQIFHAYSRRKELDLKMIQKLESNGTVRSMACNCQGKSMKSLVGIKVWAFWGENLENNSFDVFSYMMVLIQLSNYLMVV